jgi:hypothetical protein
MPQTRQLLVLIDDLVTTKSRDEQLPRSSLRFTQRQLRESLGWHDRSLRRHLQRLIELEYILSYKTGRGNEREYQLLYDGQGRDGERFLLGLIDVAKLKRSTKRPKRKRTGGPKSRTGTRPAATRRASGTHEKRSNSKASKTLPKTGDNSSKNGQVASNELAPS